METKILLALIWTHFVADFIFQTNKMALNKSKSHAWLFFHVSIYSLFFIPIGLRYAVINGALHYITDALSSRACGYLWHKQKRKEFFIVIGLDQAVHLSCLVLTLRVLRW